MRNSHKRFATAVALSAAAAVATSFVGVGAAVAAPAEGSVRGAGGAGAIKDRYIVVFKSGSAASRSVDSASTGLARLYGGAVHRSYKSAVKGFSVRLTEKAAKRLAANSAVDYVEQDRQVKASGTQANPASWGLDRIDQANLPLNKAYTYPNTASNVTAYILDTGVRISHSDFGGRARNGYDFIDSDAVAGDCNGHGTHVAGTIGGNSYGVAKGVKLVAVRVLDCQGSGSYSQIIAGIDWVTKNAVKPAVANMSLGGSAGSTLDNAVKASIASGVTYAVAGGNANADACNTSPARLPEAITVGATDSADARASFSNYGSCLDIFAPGVSITSSYNSSDTGTMKMSGTSMATPHVAGAAALLLSANPSATPAQVRNALVNNALNGKVTNPASGSPNKLLNVTSTAVAPAPAPAPTPPAPKPTTPTPGACGPFTNAYALRVADMSTVNSKLTVSGCAGNAPATTKVAVRINHSYRGDLVIDLIAPDGSTYKLKAANDADDGANVDAIFTVNASSEARNGLWKLRVRDAFYGDAGQLVSWSLTL